MSATSGSPFVGAEPQAQWQELSAHEGEVPPGFFGGSTVEDQELRDAMEDLLLEGLLLNPAKVVRAQRSAESCWDHAAQVGQEYASSTPEGRENAARAATAMVLGWINEDMTPQAAAAYLGAHPAANATQEDVPRWKAGLELIVERVTKRACAARAAALGQAEAEEAPTEEPPARSGRR